MSSNAKLWDALFSKKHLEDRYNEKIKGKSSVGLDNTTVIKFDSSIDEEISIIMRKVKNGSYTFTRYRQVLISKGAGKPPREISVPTVRDKLVSSVLNEFLVCLYGDACKSPLPQTIIADILAQVPMYSNFIKIDVSQFYASINHDILMKYIWKKIRKKQIISLIRSAITTGTISMSARGNDSKAKREKGVPEGLPVSNSLANIYFLEIDNKYKSDNKIKYYRYVDDIIVLVNDEDFDVIREDILDDISSRDLKVNQEKVEIGKIADGFTFLGYCISDKFSTVRRSSVYRLETSLEELIRSYQHKNHKLLQWRLNLKITGFIIDNNKYGWMFFYSQITDTSLLHHLDWLVKRLLSRYKLDKEVNPKKFVRSYYEITKKLHETRYIPNLNEITITEKKEILTDIYDKDVDDVSDESIEYMFRGIMRKEIQDIEKDVEHFS